MTHLRIEQSTSGNEYVTSDVIHKLYETAKGILDEEALNEVEESQVSLQGSLVVPKAYGDEVDWLETKFPDLHITAGVRYIRFADDAVYARLSLYLGDGTGITSSEITNANMFSSSADPKTNRVYFVNNTDIVSFNELGQLPQVTNIPDQCFEGCTNLTSIYLQNISNIGFLSFRGANLTGVINLPSLITITGRNAFTSCTNITEVNFNLSVFTGFRGNLGTFESCTSLLKVTGLGNITEIPRFTFSGANSLVSVDCTNMSTIGNNAFLNCSSLTSVDLSSCTRIKDDAFGGCTGLASIIDLSNCTTLGRGVFDSCSNLDITNWDLSNVTKIGTRCFYGCSKLKGTLNLSGVTTFDGVVNELFSGCSGLLKIVIGHLPVALGSSRMHSNRSPFYNCTSLKVVDINQLDGLFFSKNPIFKNTPAFEALIIRNTSLIPAITYDKYTSQALWSAFAESSTPKIYVDDNLYSTYINHADWSDLASHIEPLSNYVES